MWRTWRQLRVGNLPVEPPVTKDFLQHFFGEIGPIESIHLKSDRTDCWRRPIYYAFITYESHNDAERAMVDLNYTKLNGIPMRLSWSDPETNMIRKSGKGKLVINNLDPTIEVSQLHDALGNFGEVIYCKIATDADGKSLGYGYVQFREEKDAAQAMQDLKEATINGWPVWIEHYQKRQRQNPEAMCASVYIKDLPDDVQDSQAFKCVLLECCPEIEDEIESKPFSPQPVLMVDQEGKSGGFGFCLMKNHEAAQKLVDAVNGTQVGGNTLFATRGMSDEERIRYMAETSEKCGEANFEKYEDRKLYVRGFDETMTEEQLKEMFSRYGEVETVKIMRDRDGNSMKFGFVCYVSKDDADRCIDISVVDLRFGPQNAFVAKALPMDVPIDDLTKRHFHLSGERGAYPFVMDYNAFPQMGMMPMGFPPCPLMDPVMMPRDPIKDMIRSEILDKLGQSGSQNAIKALNWISEDQCRALVKNQDKLKAWLAIVQ